jgi:hypothetical protein
MDALVDDCGPGSRRGVGGRLQVALRCDHHAASITTPTITSRPNAMHDALDIGSRVACFR